MANELLPNLQRIMVQLGEQIKLARLRRKFTADQVAERSGLSRKTIWAIENGSSGVSLGNYVQVLFVLGLEKDMLKLAADDVLGRKIQDAALVVKERAPKKRK